MEKIPRKSILCLIFFAGISACVGARPIGTQTVMEVSGKKPEWIVKIPETEGGVMYFRGIKTGAPTLDGGINDARMHAARQVAEMVETNADINYESARVEYGMSMDDADIGSVVNDGIIMLSKGLVKGLKEQETYYEKIEEVKEGGVKYFYNCYILMTLSDRNYKKAVNKVFDKEIKKAKEVKNKMAADVLERMRRRMKEESPFGQ